MTARLTGTYPMLLDYTDGQNCSKVSVGNGGVVIDGVIYPAHILHGLAELASGNHTMSECVWVDCPEHACPYDFSHTRNWCDRPTCRES